MVAEMYSPRGKPTFSLCGDERGTCILLGWPTPSENRHTFNAPKIVTIGPSARASLLRQIRKMREAEKTKLMDKP